MIITHAISMTILKQIMKTILVLITCTMISIQAISQQLSKKWYPGHYLYVSPNDHMGVMEEANRELVKDNRWFRGYHGRYKWSVLETEKGIYDFSIIWHDMEIARRDGKKLIVHIHDRDHTGKSIPVPAYLTDDPVYEGGYYTTFDTFANQKKYMPKLWVPAVAERWGALLHAFGAQFDKDTILAYVCMEETALIGAKNEAGFLSESLRDAYKVIYSAADQALPTTVFSQYANWPGGLAREDADDAMAHLASLGHGLGGPDAVAGRRPFDGKTYLGALDNWFGIYYTKYRGIIPVTASSQAPTYKTNDPLFVLNYAIDALGAHFMSWAPLKKEGYKDNLYGILEVIDMLGQEQGRINIKPPTGIMLPVNH